ncbi:MAG: hypothetical protein LWX83_11845 [Anaerolineae bacterium]|nr:hypothetical protein [Anaerolineae bacterium]
MNRYVYRLVLLTVFCLVGCSSFSAGNSLQNIKITPDATQLFKNALLIATLSMPTQTQPSVTPSFEPTIPSTATPVVYNTYEIKEAGYVGDKMILKFFVPGINGQFQARVNNVTYDCFVPPGEVDLLSCSGAPVSIDSVIDVKVFPVNSQQIVMQIMVNLARPATETPEVAYAAAGNSGNTGATATAAPTAIPTNPPCPEWCGYVEYYDGNKTYECGFNEAWKAHHMAFSAVASSSDIPGTYQSSVIKYGYECINGLEYYDDRSTWPPMDTPIW